MRKLRLIQKQSPGDLLVLTIALQNLHLNYPNQFQTDVVSHYPKVFYNNPYITDLSDEKSIEEIDFFYNNYAQKCRDRIYRFSDVFIHMLNEKLFLCIKKIKDDPYIQLSDKELNRKYIESKFNLKKPYWVINSGIKNDIPLKQYPPYLWQELINQLNDNGFFNCDIVQAGHNHHVHPVFKGVIDLIGKTNDLRDYFALIYHSEGCINHVSLQMHIAAAFNKKCIVLAGGREEENWNEYNNQYYLNSIGKLICCYETGCWKKQLCTCETINEFNRYAKCMLMIKPENVIEVIKGMF